MKNSREKMADYTGITLIALIITIIVLLILAGVSLSMVFNQNGIFSRAEQATIEYRAGSVEEEVILWKNDKLMAKYDGISAKTRDELIEDQKSRKLLTDKEAETAKDTGKVTIGRKTIDYGEDETLTVSAEVFNISLENNDNIDCAVISFNWLPGYEITPISETKDLGNRRYFITKNGTYVFNVKNTETGKGKTEQVVVDSITGNYELGTQLEVIDVKLKKDGSEVPLYEVRAIYDRASSSFANVDGYYIKQAYGRPDLDVVDQNSEIHSVSELCEGAVAESYDGSISGACPTVMTIGEYVKVNNNGETVTCKYSGLDIFRTNTSLVAVERFSGACTLVS